MRIPPPVIMIFAMLLMWLSSRALPSLNYNLPPALESLKIYVVMLITLAGLWLDLSSFLRFFRKKTTITPLAIDKTSALVVDGFYRFTRNPMYLGMAMMILAFALYLETYAVFLILPVFII